MDQLPTAPAAWLFLGPFPCGTREQVGDPLARYGGFSTLCSSETDKYPSELADSGYTGWRTIPGSKDWSIERLLFDNVR